MSDGTLVAERVDQPPDHWSGVWIVEDIEMIADGVRNRDWVEGGLGGVSAGLDALALASDPVGVLLQYGVSWIIEHVEPLRETLDQLAGDPAQITAYAQTWRNIAEALEEEAGRLDHAVRGDVAEWGGAAGEAYRATAREQHGTLIALAGASGTMAALTEGAGMLVAGVRELVRDAIATLISRLAVYAAEVAATFGAATPLVVEQVGTTVASWAARIARWVHDLIASLRNLLPKVRRLDDLIEELRSLNRQPDGGAGPPSGKDGEDEEKRVHDLGVDPAAAKYRPGESESARRIEEETGVRLTRAEQGKPYDWVDGDGVSYDAVGNFDGVHFERQWPQLQFQIERHLDKADLVPVDVSRFTPEQTARVEQFIEQRGLGPRVFVVGK
ncbi:WXG100 family type VII secretion target [Actinoplanes sp. NPDC049802]|uniref:WXG100-like domain-containing protein n=1 Tax=Actinoplanes sp. NPDC049802 TaxID=3154742 RepID=UPI00340D3E64